MNRAVFFDAIRPLFGGLSTDQVRGLEILLAAVDGLPVRHQAYVLATAYHETAATMQPVRETLAKTDAEAARRLERAWKAGKLSWVKTPYWRADNGKYWIGRGYVQLTHKVNYERAGKRMGVDLVADPSAAMSPMLAARVIVHDKYIFTLVHKILTHSAARVWGQELQRSRLTCRSRHHNGVLHRPTAF
jgi:hypothetical protein